MSFIYTPTKKKILQGLMDFREAGSDIRALLVMTNTTAGSQEDTEFVAGLTTLDEYNGSAYVRKALATQVVNEDDPNNRAAFDADDVTWSALGAGTRSAQALVLIKFVTNDADSWLLAYIDGSGFPFAGSGADITIQWNAAGIIWAA